MPSYQPIVSLSLNPAIDLTYEIISLDHDKKSRATNTHYDPGGTGINVGRALEKLNATSHTCYFVAGTMGSFLDEMIKQELKNAYSLQVEGETRINTTILQKHPQQQYEVNASGPTITPQQLEKIIDQFLTLCGQGIGILTGSLPPGIPDNTYSFINTRLKEQNARAIIDAPVNILKKTLHTKPFLIKPNLHELETLLNKSLVNINQIATETRLIEKQGINYICVSLGEKGALLTTPDNSFLCNAPHINTLSTVGAGDSMVAGLAHAFAQDKKPSDALKLATACGTGTAKQPGTQLFNIDELDHLSNKITVKTLDI